MVSLVLKLKAPRKAENSKSIGGTSNKGNKGRKRRILKNKIFLTLNSIQPNVKTAI